MAPEQNAPSILRELRGRTPIVDLAAAARVSRYTVSRWLRERRSARQLAAREVAYREPWSHALLRALETSDYCAHGARDAHLLGDQLGVDAATLARALDSLRRSAQVREHDGRWAPSRRLSVDTRSDPQRARELKSAPAQRCARAFAGRSPGLYGYSLFSVSRADMRRIRSLQLELQRAMQAIIAASKQPECVGLFGVSLLDLDVRRGNALRAESSAEPRRRRG